MRALTHAAGIMLILSCGPLAAQEPEDLGEGCHIGIGYCASDGLYYEICASCPECDDDQCIPLVMDAISAANMAYHGDEFSECSTRTCYEEPCTTGNPSCPMLLYDGQRKILVDRNTLPWKVAFYVVCCNGEIVGGGAYGRNYCDAYRNARETALTVARRKCCEGCPSGVRCCYAKLLKSPCNRCCTPQPRTRVRLFRRR